MPRSPSRSVLLPALAVLLAVLAPAVVPPVSAAAAQGSSPVTSGTVIQGVSPGERQAAGEAADIELTAEEQEEVALFVAGNILFTLYHEAGHALIAELGLPVVGREEDAVDMLAAVLMIPAEPDEVADQHIIAAADAFAMSHDLAVEYGEPMDEGLFAGEHGLDLQRYYQLVCLIYGSDPEGFADFAADSGLPPERAEACPAEYVQAVTSWDRLIAPHRNGPGAPVSVVWGPVDPDLDGARALLRESGLMDVVAQDLSESLTLPNPITLTAESCDGDPNAFWIPADRTIVVCDDLVAWTVGLIVDDIARR